MGNFLFQAEMKKGKDETEDKVYSWVGRQMKIQITDNRILVGNGLTPVSWNLYIFGTFMIL